MAPKTEKKARSPLNSEIKKTGIMRISRGRMFHKRGLWLVEKWKKQNEKKGEEKRKKTNRLVEKKVNGDKNGGKRLVRTQKFVSSRAISTHKDLALVD